MRLTSRIVLIFVLFVASLLTIVGVLSYRSAAESLKAAAVSEMLAVAIEKEAALDQWITERMADLEQLSTDVDLVNRAGMLVAAAPNSVETRSAHAIVMTELEPHVSGGRSGFIELFVMAPEDGIVVASTVPLQEGKSKSSKTYFEHGKFGPYLQGPYRSPDLGVLSMTATVPLRSANGHLLAVLAARLDLAALNAIVQRRTGLRQTGDSFLVDADRLLVSQPRFLPAMQATTQTIDSGTVRACVAGNSGVTMEPDYRGVPVIAVYRWIANRQLGLIVKITQSEALDSAHAFGRWLLLMSTLALLATAVLASLLARTITRPLRAMHMSVRRFAEGQIESPLPESSADEVGLLAREFNRMQVRIGQRTTELAESNRALHAENTERKRAEETSRQSEENFRELAATITDVFYTTSPDMRQTHYVSPAYEQVWGQSTQSLYANPQQWADAILPEDRERVWTTFGRVATGEPSAIVEFRIVRPDGTVRWILSRGFPVKDAAGNVIRITGSATDITDRKQVEIERKNAEEAVGRQQTELRVLFDLMPAMIWFKDTKNGILRVNQRVAEAAGKSIADIEGKPSLEIYPQEAARFYADDLEVIHSREPKLGFVESLRDGEGNELWVQTDKVPYFDKNGEVIGIVVMAQDITQRKRAEAALTASESRYHSLFENMLEGYAYCQTVFEQDELRDFIYLEVNGAFEKLTGLKNIVGKKVSEVIPGIRESNRELFDIYSRVARTGNSEKYETYLEALNIWFSITVYSRDKGHFIAVFDNITEEKRASALLIESERRLTLATESAHIGIWDWDVVTNELVWDDQMYALYGIRAEDFSGAYDAWQKGLHPDDRARAEADIAAAVHGVNGFHIEFRVLWPSGEVRHIEAHALVQRANDGSAAHMIGVNWDITSRKQADLRIEALHKELLDTSRRAGMAEVATGVLHNVGNVLNSVNVSTSIVVERLRKSRVSRLTDVGTMLNDHAVDLGDFLIRDERGRQLPAYLAQLATHLNNETREIANEMQAVAANVEHIKEIINTQQSYAGSFGVLEPLDLRESIEDALRINNVALNRHHVDVVREFEPSAPVIVDKHKVLQILVNLISNAKYAMIDSQLKVLTIKTYASSDGGAQVSIQDTGCGIVAENITRIFAHGFTTKKDGHGFGLHSSALAAKEMNAVLIAHSDGAGKGAVFTLVFPPPPMPARVGSQIASAQAIS